MTTGLFFGLDGTSVESFLLLQAWQCHMTKPCTLYLHIPYRCFCIVLYVCYSNLWKEPVSSLRCHASATNLRRGSPGVTSHSTLFTVLRSVTHSRSLRSLVLLHLEPHRAGDWRADLTEVSAIGFILIHAVQMIVRISEPGNLNLMWNILRCCHSLQQYLAFWLIYYRFSWIEY